MERKIGKFCTVSVASSSVFPLPMPEGVVTELSLMEPTSSFKLEILSSPTSGKSYEGDSTVRSEIRPEYVNYLGYYSSHEQLMQQLIQEQAESAHRHIKWMIKQGSLDCQTHLLWNKLLSTSSNTLSYVELSELCRLAERQELSVMDPKLEKLLQQPLSWYQGLIKVLTTKYFDHCRTFTSPDNNTHHLLILHPRFLEGFIMLTLEHNSGRGDISVVCRKQTHRNNVSSADLYSLIEGVINACCFHLWAGML